jgi:hypothetical protein
MAKQLKDILKKAKNDSKLVPNRVSDMLKPGDEKKFASKHLIQKHGDANGNDTGVFDAGHVHYDLNFKDEKRHGRKRGEDEKVYEAVEKENTKCNESAKGTMCEVHGMADCKKAKPLTEKDEDKPPFEGPYDKKEDQKAKDKNVAKNAARKSMKQMTKEEVELDEVLTKKTPAGEWIKDFVDSDNPKFEGKSKKKRMQMALAAYYSKQREKKN